MLRLAWKKISAPACCGPAENPAAGRRRDGVGVATPRHSGRQRLHLGLLQAVESCAFGGPLVQPAVIGGKETKRPADFLQKQGPAPGGHVFRGDTRKCWLLASCCAPGPSFRPSR